jgi:membrane protein DedA with SNARE-associated domain
LSAVDEALLFLAGLPTSILYAVLGIGAALENVFPPVPADAFVVAGGLLAAHGIVRPGSVFFLTWIPNVCAAVGVYYLSRRYGGQFFKMPLARWLLREHQLEQVARFYDRWGVPAIFLGRLLPGWRAMIPVFAGVSRMAASRVIPPLVLASALWYAVLIGLGMLAGRNLQAITEVLAGMGRALLGVALALLALLAAWWWRSRHPVDPR